MCTIENNFYANKINVLIRTICFFWLFAKALSWKVWLAKRVFPVLPPFTFFFAPEPVHFILFIFSLLALTTLFFFPSKKLLIALVIAFEIASCILDENRWQPWEFEYIFIMSAVMINHGNKRNAITSIIFIFASTYCYSGINKMNPVFSHYLVYGVFHYKILNDSKIYLYNFLIYHSGYFLGITEMLAGAGLFFSCTKKTSAIFLVLMHLSIVVLFGPWGLNYDVIILPWNIAFSFVLFSLFIYKPLNKIEFISLFKHENLVFVIFFGLLPVLNFFGYWDYFFSSSFFSYKPPDMYIWIHKEGKNKALRPFYAINKNNKMTDNNFVIINVRDWAFKEMSVPAYPELRTYKAIRETMIKQYPDMNATYIVYKYLNGKKERIELK